MNLVVGATGLVGSEVCRLLRKQEKPVRALVRSGSDSIKIDKLRSYGVELIVGDLKDVQTLDAACKGVRTVVSTASATVSRSAGDSIDSVDLEGQINLVENAARSLVSSVVYVSFSGNIDEDFPLRNAKREVENRLKGSGIKYTILRPTFFMEIWLSPHLGFDYTNYQARIYGTGENKISWISLFDVSKFAAGAVDNPAVENRVIELGGPDALSPMEVVRIFEGIAGRHFVLNRVPEDALQAQKAAATDSFQRTFASLMLAYAKGDVIDMRETLQKFPLHLTSVSDYATRVLTK